METTYPKDHKPRYENFELKGFLDETLREGAERCYFTVDENAKYKLTNKLVEANVVKEKMNTIYLSKRVTFDDLYKKVSEFYSTDVMSASDILEVAHNLVPEGNFA